MTYIVIIFTILFSCYKRGSIWITWLKSPLLQNHMAESLKRKRQHNAGISKAMLYKLCKEDKIHRIVKGQYILPDDMLDELLAISNRSEKVIFSHETALYLHGISDRTPFEHTITAPSGCIPSAAIKSECKVYYIKPELFELGKTTLRTPSGNNVPAYDLERTICDVIRSRNKQGTETFLAA